MHGRHGPHDSSEAAARCSVTFQTYSPIKKGSTGAQAKAMECLLAKAGYATTVNGRFSAAEARELAKFRKSIGLNPLAVGGRRAWSALLARGTTPHLEKGDHGKAVVRLQLALRSAGFAKIPTTGRYNAATVAVVKSIQKSRHLRQTGAVNAGFWKALQAGKITASTVVAKKPVAKPLSSAKSSKGEKALAYAKKQLGDPYARQGSGRTAGIARSAHEGLAGAEVTLPHSAGSSTGSAEDLQVQPQKWRPGLLLSRYLTCGALCGNGKVIHAPRPGKEVSYIKISNMPYMGAPDPLTACGSPTARGHRRQRNPPVRVACGRLL